MTGAPTTGPPLPVVGTTPEGVLLGADAPTTTGPETTQFAEESPNPSAKYTEDDINKARVEEKGKLYSRLDAMKAEVDELKSAQTKDQEIRTTQFREEADAEAIAERQRVAQEETEMEVRDLLAKREKEWEEKFASIQQEQARDRALLEQERQYSELVQYQTRRVEEERDNIMPELVDLVSGSTTEEIDASIESLKQRSESIFNSAQESISSAQHDSAGSRVTLPSAMENPSDNAGMSPEAIRNMSLQDYAKHRATLLSPGQQGKSQGLFG